MKKFKFRLEKVLQYRSTVRDEKRREFGMAMQKLRDAEERLIFLKQEFEANKISDLEILLVEEIHIRGAYAERLKRETEEQLQFIERVKEEVEIARLAYIEATHEVGVLEKLKEKKQQVHTEMVAKAEENFLDELVTQRARFTAPVKE